MHLVVRLLAAGGAVACLSRALGCALPRRSAGGSPVASHSRFLGSALDHVAHQLEGAPALRRAGDDATAARRLALAPGAWPWRLAGAGSGYDEAVLLARLAALRVLSGVVGCAVAVVVLVVAGLDALLLAAPLVVVGAVGVDQATASAARDAERSLIAGLPDLLDCLAAAFEAGLVLEQALHLAAQAAEPPLDTVVRRALTDARLGRPPGSALREAADRCGVPALSAAAAVIDRGRRLGEPVAPALLAAAATARAEAFNLAAGRAARRSSLAALVVAAVIAPACVLAVIAVVVGGVLGAGHAAVGG